jgi:ASC-1-like (ASCH) protein
MKVGDTITFYNDDFCTREMEVEVKDIKYYKTFREYLKMKH